MIVALTDSPTSVPASLNPNLPNVAQRNLNLVAMGMGVKMFHMAFEMGAPDGEDGPGTYRLEMKQAPTEELKRLLEAFRLDLPLQGVEGKVGNFGVMDFTPCVDEQALKHARPALERVEMRPYQRRGLTLAGTLDGDAALVHVIQYREKGDIVGGISMLVYHTRDEKK